MREIKYRAFFDGTMHYPDMEQKFKNTSFWSFPKIAFNKSERSKVDIMEFTGLKDKNGTEIYESDILSDWTETDEGKVQSKNQVYWCEKTGAWKLDNSYKQDKSNGNLLSKELAEFDYEVTGNIYQ